ncbi:MAG: carboxypeptidase-like regulatory domain-containing protein [Gemmatimonadota bacterium]|jgi:hypothetical protein
MRCSIQYVPPRPRSVARTAFATVAGLLAILALCSATLPSPLAAQAVTGKVVTEDGGVPVPGARIWLMTENDVEVDSSRTDGAGRYRLRAKTPGTYRLYVALEGYASQGTTPFKLAAGQTLERDVQYNLVSIQAMHIMGDAIANDSMLQEDLPKICGEALRPWESGILVGVVRDRSTSQPIPGAVVTVQPPATPDSTPAPRSTVSNKHGTYIFCNVPEGDDITLRVRAPGRPVQEENVRVRKGMIGWYDVYVRKP